MAVPTSPNQPHHHSPAVGRNHSRRSSTRKSCASLLESPRTLCPRDGDAFSYDPAHLADWYIPQDLWERLTPKLQATLAAMQHAGAAVLTGFERLGKHTEELECGRPNHKLEEDELIVQLSALPPPKLRTTSNASSAFFSDAPSPVFTDTPNSGSTSPSLSGSQIASPVSPICLSPLDSMCFEKRERSREHSFSTPREPHDAYYAAELSHLRTEALTRLRHASRKVDQEWYEAERTNAISEDDATAFMTWWLEKKSYIMHLYEQGNRMSRAIGLSPSGMGWTYAPAP
ncbi:hypothetical protein K458DRAFT_211527 [Lentithecium fluviatile CBS 122367]|uniref:Uncharacterized protein n=1 Tax=Lentithecium fluviatile CBS 122367 TaxID=1168545 RepID=A0A6G1J823_9PLEO|nr:hypothetical protein K458DRAFT_211527 [Lentithecium fluviatile CBS 122367]